MARWPPETYKAHPYSGVDFDDAEYGFKEEDKDPLKVINFRLKYILAFVE